MRIFVISLMAAAACARKAPVEVDACVEKEVTIAAETPIAYACHDPFKAKLTVTNGSCGEITVTGVTVSAEVTSGPCAPSGTGTYTPLVATIPAQSSAVVLDLSSASFCCGAPGCAAQMSCDERFTFAVATSAASVMTTGDAHLDLGGCDTVCP